MSYKIISDKIKKSELSSFIIIYGTEEYLIDTAVKNIKEKYLNKDFENFNYSVFEKIENTFNDYYEYATTYPFLCEKKISLITEAEFLTSSGTLNKNFEDKLIKLMDDSPGYIITIFVLKEKKPDLRKKIVKKLKDNDSIYELNKLNESELTKYIIDKFKKKNFNISVSAASFIANNSGYLEYESNVNLYNINNEIHKILTFKNEQKEITTEDADNLMIKSSESNVFKLIDFLSDNNKKKAFEILDDMLLNNVPEQVIIHMIMRHYRMLYQFIILTNKGYNQNDIMKKMGLKGFVANKLSRQARMQTKENVRYYLSELLEIDRKIKTGEVESRLGLELITNGIIGMRT